MLSTCPQQMKTRLEYQCELSIAHRIRHKHYHQVASCYWPHLKQVSITAGVVPQSSCNLRPTTPASTCSRRPSAMASFPLPVIPKLRGSASTACNIALI